MRKMTSWQRLQAAIARVTERAAPRPEDNAHLRELYALAARHKAQRARYTGYPAAVRAALAHRHLKELLAVEQHYGDINRRERAKRWQRSKA